MKTGFAPLLAVPAGLPWKRTPRLILWAVTLSISSASLPGAELLFNGDFGDTNLAPWTLNIGSNPGRPVPQIAVEPVSGHAEALHVSRAPDFDGSHAIAGQTLSQPLPAGAHLTLTLQVLVNSHNFHDFTSWNAYPANVWLHYVDTNGQSQAFRRSFYLTGTGADPAPLAETLPPGQWVSRSYDVSDLDPPIDQIAQVRVGSLGWSYDVAFDNVSLSLQSTNGHPPLRFLSIQYLKGSNMMPDRVETRFNGQSGFDYEMFYNETNLLRGTGWSLADIIAGAGTNLWIDQGDSNRVAPALTLRRIYQLYLKQDLDGDGLSDGSESLMYDTDPTEDDLDGDGLSDADELEAGTDPDEADADNDGLSDSGELAAGSDPENPDTDGDGIADGVEVWSGLDPTDPSDAAGDLDNDGLTNLREFNSGTLINNPDTDGDGLYDGWEVFTSGTNPVNTDTDGNGTLDGAEDEDQDDLSHLQEFQGADGNPSTADGTDPLRPDTDGDEMPDGWERDNGFDPIDPADGALDFDNDRLANRDEYILENRFGHPGAYMDDDVDNDGVKDGDEPQWDEDADGDGDPNVLDADSDNDLLPDGTEDGDRNGLIAGDTDGNRVINGGELWTETDPLRDDSDQDGLTDLVETDTGVYVNQDNTGTDPVDPDTDNDGLPDSERLRVVFRSDAIDTDLDARLDYEDSANDNSWIATSLNGRFQGFGRIDGANLPDANVASQGVAVTALDAMTGSQRAIQTPEGYPLYVLPEQFQFVQASVDITVLADYRGMAWHPTSDFAWVPGANPIIGDTRYTAWYMASQNNLTLNAALGSVGTTNDLNAIAWHPGGDYCLVVGDNGIVMRLKPFAPPNLVFDQGTTPSTGTSENLLDVCWASDGSFAVIVGEGGAVIRYVDSPRSFTQASGTTSSLVFRAASFRPGTHVASLIGADTHLVDPPGILYETNRFALYNGDANHVSNRSTLLPEPESVMWVLRDIAWRPDGERAVIVGQDKNSNPVVLKYKPVTSTPPFAETISVQRIDQGISNPPSRWRPHAVAWRSDSSYALIVGESTTVSLVLRYNDADYMSGSFAELRRNSGSGRPRWRSVAFHPSTAFADRVLLGGEFGDLYRLDASPTRLAIDVPGNNNPLYGYAGNFPQAAEATQAVRVESPRGQFSGKETIWDSGLDPLDPDTDNDTLLDGEEVRHLGYADPDGDNLAAPLDPDSDGDGIGDPDDLYSWVDGWRYDPVSGTWGVDPSMVDGVTNSVEWVAVWHQDSDGDGLPNALDADSDNDSSPPGSGNNNDNIEDTNLNGRFEPHLGETNPLNGDGDGDGLLDGAELALGLSISVLDENGDGRIDGLDSDLDGLIDGLEPEWDQDTDGDGLVNALDLDSDNDGLPDGGIDGWNYDSTNAMWSTGWPTNGMIDPWEGEDLNLDGKLAPTETDPLLADTDGGLLSDGDERRFGTDPLVPDTDADGLTDYVEVQGWTLNVTVQLPRNPTNAPSYEVEIHDVHPDPLVADTDDDGVGDAEEEQRGSDPQQADTDRDGLTDLVELRRGCLNPANADTDGDLLSDGAEMNPRSIFVYSERTGMEVAELTVTNLGSNPCLADQDGDGVNDYGELTQGSHPYRRDTDGDGLRDNNDGNVVGVEANPPDYDWNSWGDNLRIGWKGPKATYHLAINASDNAGLASIRVGGSGWAYYNAPLSRSEEYTRTVLAWKSYDITITVRDINGNVASSSVHISSAFEAVDDLVFGGAISAALDQLEDWAQQLLSAITGFLKELIQVVIDRLLTIGAKALEVAQSALDALKEKITDHVRLDCSDYGLRISSPQAAKEALESVKDAGSGTVDAAFAAFEQALEVAEPLIDEGIVSVNEFEDFVFDSLEANVPGNFGPLIGSVRQGLDTFEDQLTQTNLTGLHNAFEFALSNALDFAESSAGGAGWTLVGPEDLVLGVPGGSTSVRHLAETSVGVVTNFIETGDIEVPCLSSLIDVGALPTDYTTRQILVCKVLSFELDAMEPAISLSADVVCGFLLDGRRYFDVYLVLSMGHQETIYWPFAQEEEIAPADFNVLLGMPFSARDRSGLGLGLGIYSFGLVTDFSSELEVTTADVSLTHASIGFSYGFPIFVATEQ